MKKTAVILFLAAGFMLGGLLAARPVHAIASPYLLLRDGGETIAAPIITLAKPKLIQPVVAPSNIRFAPLTTSTSSTGADLSIMKSPSDCIDLDTVNYGQGAYPYHYSIYNSDNLPHTYTLCNKIYDRSALDVNQNGQFLYLSGDNLTLDCNGATLIGNFNVQYDQLHPNYKMGIGVSAITSPNNLTVKNCTLGNFGIGMYVGGGYDGINYIPYPPKKVNIFNNTFVQFSYIDMVVSSATDSDIYNNTRTTGHSEYFPTIDLEFVSNSRIYDNTLFSQKGMGVSFESNYNQIYNNHFGQADPLYSINGQLQIDHGSAYNQIHDNTFTSAPSGNTLVLLSDSPATDTYRPTGGAKYNEIFHNTFENQYRAIYLSYDVHNNSIYENTIKDNAAYAFYLMDDLYNGAYQGPSFNYFRKNILINGMFSILGRGHGAIIHDNIFSQNKVINYTYGPDDWGVNEVYDENGIGNYWNTYDDPEEGCTDTDKNGICDLPYLIGFYPQFGNYDHFPVSGVPIISPIDPITVNENDTVSVSIDAVDPNGDPLTYSISDPRFQLPGECWPSVNTFEWGTNQDSAGTYTFTATVSDGEHTVSQPFTVTVRDTCYFNKWGKWVCTWPAYALLCKN